MLDFDEVLPHIGGFGRYQFLMLAIFAPIANIPCAFTYLNIIFISATPDHWCRIPQLEALPDLSQQLIKNLSIPREPRENVMRYKNCVMYDLNYTQVAYDVSVGHVPRVNESAAQIECKYGWNYDRSSYDYTLVTEMDVVCSKRWMQSMAQSSFFVGTITGSIIFGNAGNRYGRKPVFFILVGLNILAGLLASFSPNYLAYIIYRGFMGTTSIVMFQIPFTLAMEMVLPKKRSSSGMLLGAAFPLAVLLLVGVAYFARNWFLLSLLTSVPLVIFLVIWYFVAESPRWLLVRNRVDEAEVVVQRIARINNKKIPRNFLKEIMKISSVKAERTPDKRLAIIQIVRHPNIRKKFLIISFAWLTNTIVYVGLSLGSTMLGINDYLAVIITGLVEVPGIVVAWWLMDVIGRRWIIFCSMLLGGVSSFCAGFIPSESVWTILILANVGKLGITGSFSSIYVFAGELFPTVLRTFALATTSLIGSCGAISAPQILYLGTLYGRAIPVIILGLLSVVGGIAVLFLPETLNENLPESLQEGEAFGEDSTFWNFPCISVKNKKESSTVPEMQIKLQKS